MKRAFLISGIAALALLVPVASADRTPVTASASPNPQTVDNYFTVTVCGLKGLATPFTVLQPDGTLRDGGTLYRQRPSEECASFPIFGDEVGEYVITFYKNGDVLASATEEIVP